jgi:putative ABC transport system permease protein
MSLIDGLRHRLRALLRRDAYEREMDDEIRFHLEIDAMHEQHAGPPGTDARIAAQRRFGRTTAIKEATRRASGIAFVDVLAQDLRFAFRSWGARTGRIPAIVTVLTLAVGIGAMTAIYSVVQAILIRPLPVRDPERLVSIQVVMPEDRGQRVTGSLVSQTMYQAWTGTAVLEDIAGFLIQNRTVTGLGATRRTLTFAVTTNLFDFLGAHPAYGRGFFADEAQPGAAPVAILSSTFAIRNFGSDTAAVGRTIVLDGRSHEIVGVMNAAFRIPGGTGRVNDAGDIWTPMPIFPDRERAAAFPVDVIGRLAPGVTESTARARLDAILTATALPSEPALFGKVTQMVSPHRVIVDGVRRPLLLLGAASAVLLLIACANVANMMLARAVTRRREIAVRVALGAARTRLVRQLLTESIAMACIGGGLGVLVAYAALPVILALAGNQLPSLGRISIDAGVLAVALIVSIVVGILVGLAPALESRRTDPQTAMKDASVNTTLSRWSQLTSNGLIAAEVGLALVLLASMGLIARSFISVVTLDRGYETSVVAMASIGIPPRYRDATTGAALTRTALARLEAIPGVVSASASSAVPLLSSSGTRFSTGSAPTLTSPWSEFIRISDGYFATMGIPLLRGRLAVAPDEVVLDETAARTLFPDGAAMGQRINWGNARNPSPATSGSAVVVGIAGDIHEVGSDDNDLPSLSTPLHVYRPLSTGWPGYFAVRAAEGDPARLLPALRAAFSSIDPDITVDIADAVDNMLRARYAQERFLTQLMLALAGIALFLAVVGMYSVVSYAAARRTREIGIRVALGARARDIVNLMMRRALTPVAIGIVAGLGASIATARLLRSQLFEVSPTDPLVLASVTVVLCGATLVASYLPSSRATRVEPTIVLRED